MDDIKSRESVTSLKFSSVYLHSFLEYNFLQSSYECALVALGSTIELMEQILKKKITNGLAITR